MLIRIVLNFCNYTMLYRGKDLLQVHEKKLKRNSKVQMILEKRVAIFTNGLMGSIKSFET
jgi:hypothetical protein